MIFKYTVDTNDLTGMENFLNLACYFCELTTKPILKQSQVNLKYRAQNFIFKKIQENATSVKW